MYKQLSLNIRSIQPQWFGNCISLKLYDKEYIIYNIVTYIIYTYLYTIGKWIYRIEFQFKNIDLRWVRYQQCLPNLTWKFWKSQIIVSHRPWGPLAEKIRQVASHRVTHQTPAAAGPLRSNLQRVFCTPPAIAMYVSCRALRLISRAVPEVGRLLKPDVNYYPAELDERGEIKW